MVASKNKLEAVSVGELPPQLATLVNTTARCEEMAVVATLEGDAKKVFWACAFDPLTSAVLSLDEIQEMVNEMLAQFLLWSTDNTPRGCVCSHSPVVYRLLYYHV